MLPKMVRCQAASLIPPKMRKTALKKRTMPRKVRVRSRPQVMSRRHLMVKIGGSTLTPRTPSPVLVSSSEKMRTPTPSQTPVRKSSQHGKSGARTVLRRAAPRRTPVNHSLPRKSPQLTRHSMMGLGKECGCLTHALMLGIATKFSMVLWAEQHETPWSVSFPNIARHNPTTLTPWGHLWITWGSAGSLTAYGQTSMTCATSMPWG